MGICKQRYILNCLLSILSGFLLSVCFTYKKVWFLCFISLIPLFIVILSDNYSIKKQIRYMLLFSVAYYVTLMSWLLRISVILPFSINKARVVLFIATIIIGFLQGFYICISTMFFCKIRKGDFRDVLYFSALFILGEWLMENTPLLAFPWGKIGVIATESPAFIQSASIFGELFISLLILVINGGLAFALLNFNNIKKVCTALVTIALVFSANIIFGITRINLAAEKNSFKAMVVQGNFSGLDKWSATTEDMFARYLNLTRNGCDDETKLALWPESAIPVTFSSESNYAKQLITLAKDKNITLVVGFFINEGGEKSYNSLLAVSPDGSVSKPYNKQVLAPFGEYFPLGEVIKRWVPSLADIIDSSSCFQNGDKSEAISTQAGNIGGIICYESIFSDISRQNVLNGANILTIATNDSWFGDSAALYQHHSHAIMRAVETNRFVLRASNTGISSIISPTGRVESSATPYTPATSRDYVYLNDEITFYCKMGNIIILPCLIIYIYSFVRFIRKKNDK